MKDHTLRGLNDHLFAQLERISKADAQSGDLKPEIERTRAVASIASQIIANGALSLKAAHLRLEYGIDNDPKDKKQFPKMLRDNFLGDEP